MTIQPADVVFNQQGTPIANQFDDIYFSNQDGLAESEFVFLHNNHLPERWLAHQYQHFVVAETGFGSGLNFLACWRAFQLFRQQHPDHPVKRLHFISTEKYPLHQQDLIRTLAGWPTLHHLAEQLQQQYPEPIEGCHRLQFDRGTVSLDLWLGDIQHSLPQWHCPRGGLVDAWFLDGFAPSKNPQMWQESLYRQMARLGKPGSTFATFTAAGAVRRGLQAAGYEVKKVPGFGRKREMLAGTLNTPQPSNGQPPYYQRNKAKGQRVSIIGAGLAAANLAFSLVQRGYDVSVYHQGSEVADGASGNPQGGFYPQLHTEINRASVLQAQAFLFARQRYQQLLNSGYPFAHQFCGVLQLAFTEQIAKRYSKMVDNAVWPVGLISAVNDQQASEIAGLALPYSAMHIADGGWISPPELVKALFAAAHVSPIAEHQLQQYQQDDEGWTLYWQDKTHSHCDILILACGHQSPNLPGLAELPLRWTRGQVEQIPSQPPLNQLKTVLCHKGYLTPAMDNCHALGSTYVKQDDNCDYRLTDQQHNQHTIQKALSGCDWVKKLKFVEQGRAAVRLSTPDHLPLVGQLADWSDWPRRYNDLYKALPVHLYPDAQYQDNLYCLTGLGSRGLTTAPLLAETLAAQISGEPLPLGQDILDNLTPQRFLIRALQRRQQQT